MNLFQKIFFLQFFWTQYSFGRQNNRPHIILIVSDDIGSRDCGYCGSDEVPTPNLDALAYNGIIFSNFYTQPACSPSRAALLTGKYPIRSGMQGYATSPGEDIALPFSVKLMPEHLKKLGYKTHLVGKWHQGNMYRNNTPMGRGFDSFFGYWNGFITPYSYKTSYKSLNIHISDGFDLHNAFEPEYQYNGTFITDLLTKKALNVISSHDSEKTSLFMMLCHFSAHATDREENLAVRSTEETNLKFSYIEDPMRRRYVSNVNDVDDSVGKVVKALSDKKMLENSIILYFSDNGAPTVGLFGNTGSNWPLRGIKHTHFEGGIKGSLLMVAPQYIKAGQINSNLFHIVDIFPTLYKMAGGSVADLGKLDGLDQSASFLNRKPGERREFLVDIDEISGFSSIVAENRKYKLVIGNFDTFLTAKNASAHLGSSGNGPKFPSYNTIAIETSVVNAEIEKIVGTKLSKSDILRLRLKDINCNQKSPMKNNDLKCVAPICLFDLIEDPCEYNNIASENHEIVAKLKKKILGYRKGLVRLKPRFLTDPLANPNFYNGTWCTWLENHWCPKSHNLLTMLKLYSLSFLKYIQNLADWL